ncbi:MAG: hypothetical protein ORN58_00650, partial [Sediminibacterium sp.]|nr:hypothetical protein [Sediminibacterium sp.]
VLVTSGSTSTLSTEIGGLTNGVSYKFKVVALNGLQDYINASLVNLASDTATSTSVTPIGNIIINSITQKCDTAIINFSPPPGYTLSNYTVTAIISNGATITSSGSTTISIGGNGTLKVAGVGAGVLDTFRVSGYSGSGNTTLVVSSDSLRFFSTQSPLNAPTISKQTITTSNSNKIVLSNLLSTLNTNNVNYYTTNSYNMVASDASFATRTNGSNTTFSYFASLSNTSGCLSPINSLVIVDSNIQVPGVPTGVVANSTGKSGEVSVTFVAGANNNGIISQYTVTATDGVNAVITASGITTPILLNGLVNNRNYSFTVKATNVAGQSLSSSAVNATPIEEGAKSYRVVSFQTTTNTSSASITNFVPNYDYINLPTLQLDSIYTVETWFKLTNATNTGNPSIYNLGGWSNGLILHTGSGQNSLDVKSWGAEANGLGLAPGSGPLVGLNLVNGIWYHFAVVVKGINTKVYVNGNLIKEYVLLGTATNNNTFTNNGIGLAPSTGSMVGQWEDFRIWKGVRDSNQIKEYMTKYPTTDGTITGTANLSGLYLWLPLNQGQKYISTRNIDNKTLLINASTAAGAHNIVDTIYSISNLGSKWNYETNNKRVLGSFVSLPNGQNVQYSIDSTNWTNATYQIPITNSFIDSIAPPSNFYNGKIYSRIFNGVTTNRTLNTFSVTTVPTVPSISIQSEDMSKASIRFSIYGNNSTTNTGNISTPPTLNKYIVKASPGNITASSTTNPVTISGLSNGVTYTIKGVTSNDGIYYSDSSDGSLVTLISKPSIDSIVVCDTVATMYFKAPITLGTATIASYTVGIRNTSTNVLTQITNISNTSTSLTITGLANAQVYNFIITAISNQNSGATVVSSTDSLSNITVTAIPIPNVASTSSVCTGSLDSTLQRFVNPTVYGFGVATGFNWYNSTSSTTILNKSVGIITATNYYFSQLINLPKKYTNSGSTTGVCEGLKRAVVNINLISGASFTTNVSAGKTGSYCSVDNYDSLNVTVLGVNPTYQWYRVRYNISGTTAQDTFNLPVLSYISSQLNKLTLPTYNASNLYNLKADSGTFKYYVVVNTTCGNITSNLSGNINIYLSPNITTQPSTELQTYCANANTGITALGVIGSPATNIGNSNLTYRWYYDSSTTDAVNNFINSKKLITGATNASFTPESNVSGFRKYYAEITNGGLSTCRITSNASGTITINQPVAVPTIGEVSYNYLINDTLKYLDTNIKIANNNNNIKWYSNVAGTTQITNLLTPLIATGTYYATQTVNNNGLNCASNTLPVTININYPARVIAAPTIVSVGNGQAIINIEKNTSKNSGGQYDSATQFQISTNPASGITTVLANSFGLNTNVTIPNLQNKQAYTFTVKSINTATKADSISSSSASFIPNYDSIINYKSTSFKAARIGVSVNGDYINLPTLYLDTIFTIETWFNLDPNTGIYYPFIYNIGGWGDNSTNTNGLIFDNNSNRTLIVKSWGDEANNSDLAAPNGKTGYNLSTNIWYHIAVVVNGRNTKIYINGNLIKEYTSLGNPLNHNTFNNTFIKNRIGNAQDLDAGLATTLGKYEDFRIWKKAKTALEVYQQYNAKLTGTETGLYYWLPLGNMQHERFITYKIPNLTELINSATSAQSLGNSNSTINSIYDSSASWYYDNIANPTDRRLFFTHRSYNNGEFTEISIDGGGNWYRANNLPSNIGVLSTLNLNDELLIFKQRFRNGVIKARIKNNAGTSVLYNLADYVIQTVTDTVKINNIRGIEGGAIINFSKPVDTGLSTIMGYQVINNGSTAINANGRTGIASGTEIPGLDIPGNSTSVTITGLTNNTMYRFALKAINTKGISDTTVGWNVTPLDTARSPNITICDTVAVISFDALAGLNYTIIDTNINTNIINVQTGTTSATNKIVRPGLLNGNTYRFYITLSSLDGLTQRTNTVISKSVNKIEVSVLPQTYNYCQANNPINFNSINTTGGNGLYTYRWYNNTSNNFSGATLKTNVQINTDTPYIKTVADNSSRYYFVSVGDSINGSAVCTNLITWVGILVATVIVYTNPTITNIISTPVSY